MRRASDRPSDAIALNRTRRQRHIVDQMALGTRSTARFTRLAGQRISPCPLGLHGTACCGPRAPRSDLSSRRRMSSERAKGKAVPTMNHWDMMRFKDHERPEPVPVAEYTALDSAKAAKLRQPPTTARMLTRDFIEDALYNPHYGYFTKRANIFRWDEPPEFGALLDELDFTDKVARLYAQLEPQAAQVMGDGAQQLWHTPVELFRPWYGYAVANYILTGHRRREERENAARDLLIFEVGGGNGTMMMNVLDYLRERAPDLYGRTRYTVIEISPKLSRQQAKLLADVKSSHPRAFLVNKSIFEWDQFVPDECFFLASEVIDNFAHDVIRYDTATFEPRQGLVLVSESGDYSEAFEEVSDPLISKFLAVAERIGYASPARKWSSFWRLRNVFPFAPNLSEAEFIPVRTMELFQRLHDYFPAHRLVLSDFSMLPDTVPGTNGPVVQIRHQQSMIPCTTHLVQPGRFDIFFPSDFELLRALYALVCHRNGEDVSVQTQRQFMEAWSDPEKTTTLSGERPMLSMYTNMKWLLS